MSEESTMKERMMERLFYAIIMVLLAKWGGFATDEAITQTQRAEGKREQVSQYRELARENIVYLLEIMEEQGCTLD